MKRKKIVPVTKTYLPPLSDYIHYLQTVWNFGWITNNGKLVARLERKLKEYLGVKHLFFLTNGTIGLQIAIKALNLHGEIITTPFSYIASTSSIIWENCIPIFADIDPHTLCISPDAIERLITKKTKAILAVHVYGNVCNVEKIGKIAKRYNVKVIYDAAHAFAVKYNGRSVLEYGDISVLSFHATKVFHTGEGGAIVTSNDELAHVVSYMRNFGHMGYDEDFWGLGINGKNSELHAALGLCMLKHVDKLIAKRKKITEMYDEFLKDEKLIKPTIQEHGEYNYAYYPIIFRSEAQLLQVRKVLHDHNIIPRRYFFPSLHSVAYIKKKFSSSQLCPIATDISRRILCLPFHHRLTKHDIMHITRLVKTALRK